MGLIIYKFLYCIVPIRKHVVLKDLISMEYPCSPESNPILEVTHPSLPALGLASNSNPSSCTVIY